MPWAHPWELLGLGSEDGGLRLKSWDLGFRA